MSLGCLGAHGDTGCCRGDWDCYVRRRQVGTFLLSSSSAVVSGMGAYLVGWDSVFWTGMVAGEIASSQLFCCSLLALAALSKVLWHMSGADVHSLLDVFVRKLLCTEGSGGCVPAPGGRPGWFGSVISCCCPMGQYWSSYWTRKKVILCGVRCMSGINLLSQHGNTMT
eukprot:scaffold148852_cov38-Attheya_sp.AAC.1